MIYYTIVNCQLLTYGNDMCIVFCNAMATLKPTKTRRIMLRCSTCGALVFANGIISLQGIKMLKDFVIKPLRGLLYQQFLYL